MPGHLFPDRHALTMGLSLCCNNWLTKQLSSRQLPESHHLFKCWQTGKSWYHFIFPCYAWTSSAGQTSNYKLRPVKPAPPRLPDAIGSTWLRIGSSMGSWMSEETTCCTCSGLTGNIARSSDHTYHLTPNSQLLFPCIACPYVSATCQTIIVLMCRRTLSFNGVFHSFWLGKLE